MFTFQEPILKTGFREYYFFLSNLSLGNPKYPIASVSVTVKQTEFSHLVFVASFCNP